MIEFNESTHTYTSDGAKVPSVSTIINDLLGSDYSNIDPFYANRGTAVHKAIELYLSGSLDKASLDEHVSPYFEAFLKFEKETDFVVEEAELRIFSQRLWFAGTLDLIGTIGGKKYLLDIKTGSKQKWHNLQTAGYAIGYGDEEIKRGCIYVKKNETYQLQPHLSKTDFMVFESMTVVFNKRGDFK